MSGSLAPAAKIFFLSDEKSMFVLSASHLSWFHLTSASAIKLGTVICSAWNTIGNMTGLFHGIGTLCAEAGSEKLGTDFESRGARVRIRSEFCSKQFHSCSTVGGTVPSRTFQHHFWNKISSLIRFVLCMIFMGNAGGRKIHLRRHVFNQSHFIIMLDLVVCSDMEQINWDNVYLSI